MPLTSFNHSQSHRVSPLLVTNNACLEGQCAALRCATLCTAAGTLHQTQPTQPQEMCSLITHDSGKIYKVQHTRMRVRTVRGGANPQQAGKLFAAAARNTQRKVGQSINSHQVYMKHQ